MAKVLHGREVYSTTCFACHAADAKGIANLGKDLTSGFSKETGDADLVAMIMRGRQPGEPKHTSAAPMPPKGGNETLTRSDVADVVAYLRSVQDPFHACPAASRSRRNECRTCSRANRLPCRTRRDRAPTPAPTNAPAAVFVVFNPESAARGKKVYNSCIACHGKTGVGVANLGAD